ncbi:EpsG family protein [Fredinandcohnia quinoae]|uniref:EpsG family protein n=1 Tax=Fredinandcohnia quinoae TaxID=2918902 RepID=A0AAW5DW78_9BACI|nr:EpsG family protein [Fredinandcohnia sp. SECRCQ15]MCH1624886.1 EpsG family protein [Fredinandcohnia sp. SECRCQ15]
MMILLSMLFSSYFFGYLSDVYSSPNTNSLSKKRNNLLFIALSFVIVTTVAAFRQSFVDTGTYRKIFVEIGTDWNLVQEQKDFGFGVLMVLLNYVSNHPQTIIIATSILINILVFRTLYKYCARIELGIFLFITTGCFALSMNGIRQFIAAAIIFCAIKLVIEGKWKLYFFVVLLAATFHGSAIIMIPVYFIIRRKAWSWSTFILTVCSILGYLSFNLLIPFISNVMAGTQYENNLNYLAEKDSGVNIIRIFVHAVPVILAFWKRKRLQEVWNKSDIFVNLSVLNLIIMVFSYYSWIISRIAFYFQIFNILLIPLIIIFCFDKKTSLFLYYSCFVLYTGYFYYEMVYMFKIDFKLIF